MKKGRKPLECPASYKNEFIEITDENCNTIGVFPRNKVHKEKICHKIVHIFLFNKEGEILLQKKSTLMDENPGKWSSSVSGHVKAGESFLTAAYRELKEELNVKLKIQHVDTFTPSKETDFKCVGFFVGELNKPVYPNPIEIEEVKFFSQEEVNKMIEKEPEKFSKIFIFLWKFFTQV